MATVYSNVTMPVAPFPINTFGGMKEAVQLWADRDDEEFVNQIPNFITFSLKEVERLLMWPSNQKEVYMEISDGWAYVPTDYVMGDYMRFTGRWLNIRETNFEEVLYKNGSDNTATLDTVKEVVFCRLGSRYAFHPAINCSLPEFDEYGNAINLTGDEVVFGYYFDPLQLTEDSDTNPIIKLAPELVLYGALKHASIFTSDSDMEKVWTDRQQASANQINKQIRSEKMSTGKTVVSQPNFNSW
ncbi:phage adaptor protein [Escherichia coli]